MKYSEITEKLCLWRRALFSIKITVILYHKPWYSILELLSIEAGPIFYFFNNIFLRKIDLKNTKEILVDHLLNNENVIYEISNKIEQVKALSLSSQALSRYCQIHLRKT